MERNGSTTGGDDSNSKDIIHEDGVIDELASHRWDIPGRCVGCPMIGLEVKGWEDIVDGVKKTREMILKEEGGVFADIARQSPSGRMDDLALNDIAKKNASKD